MPRVGPGAPHHTPPGVVEQQAEQVGDAGSRGVLFPLGDLRVRRAGCDDREQQGRAFGLRRELRRRVARQAGRLGKGSSEARARTAAQGDHAPRAQRRVVGHPFGRGEQPDDRRVVGSGIRDLRR
jgi:hypothetical protein